VRIVLSSRAEAELEQVFADSLARWGEAQARRYAEQIDRRLSLLTKISGAGRARAELGAGIRSIPAGSHIVFFKLLEREVLILSVRHAKRRSPDIEDLI
jgi:toxin ParE1/3/4